MRTNVYRIDTLLYTIPWGPGSVVSIATDYGLDGPGIESRWGARFSAPVQTGPGAHPAFCTMGTGSFLGVKSGRGVTLTPHPLLVPWSRKGRAIPLPLPMGRMACTEPQCCTRVTFTFTFLYLHFCTIHTFISNAIKMCDHQLHSLRCTLIGLYQCCHTNTFVPDLALSVNLSAS